VNTPPFLHLPFPASISPKIAAGWEYDDWEVAIHGMTSHGAIDFALPKGTPIYAAADGLAVATFGESLMLNNDNTPRLKNGKEVYYGSGLMIQIWHGKGRYTQYLHLDSIDPSIPYYWPQEKEGHLLNAPELRSSVAQYGKEVPALKVRAGQYIGTVGCTGLGLGNSTYQLWKAGDLNYETWDNPHLHLTVCGKRSPKTRNAERWDPFGIYGHAKDYPKDVRSWSKLPNSLWI